MNYSEYLPYLFAFIIAIPFFMMLKQFVNTYTHLKNKELHLLGMKANAENRQLAYERMTIFLERLKPSNLINKFDKNLKAHEFLFLTEKSINEEFEYNAAQQLYLSKNAWQEIIISKNIIIQQMHQVYESMRENTSIEDFKSLFLMTYINGEDVISNTINQLKKESFLLNNN